MEQSQLLEYAAGVFDKLKIQYFVTGSIASIYFGEPRFTNDIDIVAEINLNHIQKLVHHFPENEYYVSEDAIKDAVKRKSQFNIIHPASGLKIDVIIPKRNAFDLNRFQRICRISPSPEFKVNFSSPEDVIISKLLFYKEGGSDKHVRDITGILTIMDTEIDKEHIDFWCRELDLSDIWGSVLQRLSE